MIQFFAWMKRLGVIMIVVGFMLAAAAAIPLLSPMPGVTSDLGAELYCLLLIGAGIVVIFASTLLAALFVKDDDL